MYVAEAKRLTLAGARNYAYIGAQKAYVNLGFYRGTSLTDPDGLLEGTGKGKGLRHIKVKSVAAAKRPPSQEASSRSCRGAKIFSRMRPPGCSASAPQPGAASD